MPGGGKALPNNSLITTLVRDRVPSFRCLSGSARVNVGHLIGPRGRDITLSTSDPFFARWGGSYNPGTLSVRSVRSLRREESGIYTYRTPDERGNFIEFYFGLYHSNQSGEFLLKLVNYIDYTALVLRSCDFQFGLFPH